METSDASLMPIMHYVYIFIALITIGLLILAGVTICCIFKLTLHRNKGESINVDHEYYEVIDPIYEAVSIAVKGSNQPGTQIEMKNNDAYKSKTASHASVGINIENNEAYIHITPEIDALQTEHNMSYVYQLQGPPFDLNNAVILEGHTSMQERYENKSVCNSDNIQQVVSGQGNTSTSQNVEQVPLCIESVDLNNNTASYRSSELTIEPQLQGVCLSELSWEKQSIDSNDVESHTDEAVQ